MVRRADPEWTGAMAASMTQPIIALVADLIFESKIAATAKQIGASVLIERRPEAVLQLLSGARGLIVDMSVSAGRALQLVRDSKAARPELRVLAFLAHVEVELAKQTREAGADEVLPRSEFTARLAEILETLGASTRDS